MNNVDKVFVYNFLHNGTMFDLDKISDKNSHEYKLKRYFNECCYIFYYKLGRTWKIRKQSYFEMDEYGSLRRVVGTWKDKNEIYKINKAKENRLKESFYRNMNINLNKYRFKKKYFERLSY